MKKTTKVTLAITTALMISSHAFAADTEKVIDPSDLTRANTAAFVGLNNQGDVKASGSLSYSLKNGQMAMTTLEGTMDSEGKYSDSRLQYFHVFNLDSTTVPRIAASVDIIDNKQFTTTAVGAIGLFQTPIKTLKFFARGGVLAGKYNSGFAEQLGASNRDIKGGMLAGYAVWNPGADGTYFAAYPELTYLGGDIDITSVKTTLMAATPLSADKTRWGQLKIENTYTKVSTESAEAKTDETVAWVLYKVFF